MDDKEKNIYLIDAYALCYRAFYAIQSLNTSTGFPTNAVYGFINMLKKILRVYDPKMLAVVFDSAAATVRHKKYKEYKIHRKPMPDDLISQIPKIKQVIKAYGIEMFQMEGFEADDIIATLAEQMKTRGFAVTIVTGDKDALQLIDEKTKVLSPHMGKDKLYGAEEVEEKYGVTPSEMVDLMALMGDASDNIPGVKGIGRVMAGKLIGEYRTLENVYGNIDEISSESVKKKLIVGKEMAEFSRQMVELDRDLPIEIDVKKLCVGNIDTDRLVELYRELEFEKLLMEIMPKEIDAGVYLSKSEDTEIKEVFKAVKANALTAFSVRLSHGQKKIKAVSFSFEEGKAFYVVMPKEETEYNFAHKLLKDVLEDENIRKVCYNAKKEMFLLCEAGIKPKGIFFDVLLADYLIDPARSKYDLAGMAIRCLGYKLHFLTNAQAADKTGQATMALSTDTDDKNSVSEESDIIFRLYGVQKKTLEVKGLDALFYDVEMPLVKVLFDMETEGVDIDLAYLKKGSISISEELRRATSEIYSLAGEEFNINSPKQLQNILYEKLKLPTVKKTKTGFSTDESVLKVLAKKHSLPKILLEYRELNKLKTGYYDSLMNLAVDSKIYGRFNQAVTATGRLSSSEPNLQNIPIKTELGRSIRRAFIARGKEQILLSADYSQIELRVLAHLSADESLIEAFKKGEDIHTFTAELIFDCSRENVTKKMRRIAKTVNFGIAYGMSPFGLAKDLDIGFEEAQKFIEAYFERYPGIKSFIDETIDGAAKNGFVTTILKRRRYISGLGARDRKMKGFAERIAVNTPVQGTAADIIKLAMIKCQEAFKNSEVRMIIQVHDELVFKIPEKSLRDAAGKIKDIMENVIKLKVPLKVDMKAGKNWLDAEPLD
ncbi:MAG: DNA polymerase I [Candidatus Omnitrophica bacterium]|nr:DNA polymerase I [Candidatus Omnitrophota bacterium]